MRRAPETKCCRPVRRADGSGAGIAQGFKVTNTSAPIREGNFVAWFGTYESTGQAEAPILNVVRLSDGKVVDQWVYPAP